MAELISFDPEYREWLRSVSQRYRQSQIKAAVSVNQELIAFYWDLGRDISEREKKWGTGFYNTLSNDLQKALPEVKGFAVSNLRYVRRFCSLYAAVIRPQVVGEMDEDELFSIPWGHHRLILDRCKGDVAKAIFFVRKTIHNNWSRSVLMKTYDMQNP